MRLIYGQTERVAAWVAAHIDGCDRGFGDCTAIGVERDELIAGIVYHNWHPEAGVIEVSGAAIDKRWIRRDILAGLFEYPFSFCQMIVAHQDKDNRTRRMFKALGADEYVIPRLRGRDRDGYITTITAEQWAQSRFNARNRHGQTKASDAP